MTNASEISRGGAVQKIGRSIGRAIVVIAAIILVFLICGVLINIFFRYQCGVPGKPKEIRIISPIGQARLVMLSLYKETGNYDRFDCNYKSMVYICQEIDSNYGPVDGKQPTIIHDSPADSQATCIYSPLSQKQYWYCADSRGHAGYTSTNPGGPGYCVEGESAVCPPLLEDVP